MNYRKWPILLPAFAIALSLSAPASAQTFEPTPHLLQLEQDYKDIRIGGPVTGVVLTPLLIASGSVVLMAGGLETLCFNVGDVNCESEPRSRGGKALMAAGATAMIGGLVGLVISAKRLRDKNRKRRDLKTRMRRVSADPSGFRVQF